MEASLTFKAGRWETGPLGGRHTSRGANRVHSPSREIPLTRRSVPEGGGGCGVLWLLWALRRLTSAAGRQTSFVGSLGDGRICCPLCAELFGDSGGECHALTKNCFFVGCSRRVSRTIVLLTSRGRRLESRSLWWCLDDRGTRCGVQTFTPPGEAGGWGFPPPIRGSAGGGDCGEGMSRSAFPAHFKAAAFSAT